ncbi:MAG: hypothetical protein QM704_20835 [Anaeromyxobacteraceae bacterium]
MIRPRLLPFPVAALLAAGLGGCAQDFLPESYLDGLRVLSIAASPTELGPDESVTLTPTVYATAADPVASATWKFCPLTLGSAGSFACALPACEVTVTPDPDGTVTQDPTALALDCLTKLAAAPPPGFEPGQVPDTIETTFRLTVTSQSGDVREALKRVTLHTKAAPSPRNLPPVIAAVELGGAPAAGGATLAAGGKLRVTVRIDPASIGTYQDGNGRTVQEAVAVWFYATAGRLDDPRGSAPVAETDFVAKELLASDTTASIYVVARDLRGGEAVAGPFTVTLVR